MQRLQAAGRLVKAAWTGRQVPPFRRKILFEALEQRVLLSADLPGLPGATEAGSPGAAAIQSLATTISWVGTANGFWDDITNWRDTNDVSRLPTINDDVLIDIAGANPVITVRSAAQAAEAHSLITNESFVIGANGILNIGGELTVQNGNSFQVGGRLSGANVLAGGTLTSGGSSFTNLGTLDQITLGGTVVVQPQTTLIVTGGLTFSAGGKMQVGVAGVSGFARVTFSGNQTISGTGEIFVPTTTGNERVEIGGNVTLGSGVTVHGKSGTLVMVTSGTLTNQGTIAVDQGGTFNIGQAQSSGQVWTNAAGGKLVADGGTLNLNGTWSNAGEIIAGATAGSVLNLGGSFTRAGLGTLTRNGTVNNAIRLAGTLDNTGATLALDATTGSWDLVGRGTLKGGTLSTTGGAQLNAIPDASFNRGTLDGVTLSGTVVVTALTVTGGLTLTPGSLVQLGPSASVGGGVVFTGDQTVGGTGEIRSIGSSPSAIGSIAINNNVTFGPGITVSSAGRLNVEVNGIGFFTNQGTIGADSGGDLWFGLGDKSWTNAGVLRAEGARLRLLGSWSNTGTIVVGAAAGSMLDLGGNFTTAGLGTITRNGTANNSINIVGTLNNTGATLALNATTGAWKLNDGTIRGGTVTTADGVRLFETGFTSMIDGITLGGTLFANRVRVTNGLTLLPGGLFEIGGTNADGLVTAGTITFLNAQTIGGTGVIRFGGPSSGSSFSSLAQQGGQLTIGSGITVDGLRGSLGVTSIGIGGSVVNQGTIAPNAGGNFDIGGGAGNFTNAAGGILKADGATMRLLGAWTNAGQIVVGAAPGSVLNLDGTFTTARLGNYTRTGGAINLLGALDNTGATLALNAATGSWNLTAFGKIKGGTLSTSDGTALTVSSLAGFSFDAELEGLTLSGTILVQSSGLTVKGGLTLTAGSLFQIGQIVGSNTTYSQVTIEGSQTIGGTGEIRFIGARPGNNTGSSLSVIHAGSSTQTALTIAPGITLAGGTVDFLFGNGVTVTNKGTITSASDGSFIGNGQGTFINEGAMLYTNAGVSLRAASMTFADGSTFTNPGGVTRLFGRLENTGKTLTLDSNLGIFALVDNGTIKGGIVETVGANELEFFHDTGILDGVVLRGTANLATPRTNFLELRVLNGLTLDNGLIKLGVSAPLTFVGTQTFGGTGTVLFADHSTFNASNNRVVVSSAGTTLTIAPGITIRGKTGRVEAVVGAAFDLQGTIASDDGGTITVTRASNISPTALTGGQWLASGTGTLKLVGTRIATNAADIVLDGAGARILDDNSTTATLSALITNAAAGNLTLRNGARYGPSLNFDNAGEVTIGAGSVFSQLVTSQFANSVVAFSSQFGTAGFSAAQATGAPNTNSYGNLTTAWRPLAQNGGPEFITVGFATPVFADGATIRETWGNGFVTQVDVLDTNDVLHTVWTGVDPSQPGAPVDFRVSWDRTPYLVKGVKIYIDTTHNPGTWEEIDAIQLHGVTTAGTYRQTAGTTLLDGGSIVFGAVDLQGGSLTGTGRIDADLANAALVAPGAPTGTLTITRNYTQTAAGHLDVDIGGTVPGTQYDRLAIQGNATLAGTLDIGLVNGFGPATGQTFDVMTYAGATGAFGTINGAQPMFVVDQAPTMVRLNAVATAPDLAFDSLTIPVGGTSGEDLIVSYQAKNLGASPALGDWFDSIYISASPVFDESALLLGRVHHVGEVAGNGNYVGALQAPVPNLAVGNYHVYLLVDSRGDVPDSDRGNNIGTPAGTLAITVPLLAFGTPVEGEIAAGQDVYYRMVVPPGQDFSVEAAFGALNQAEFYLRYGALPDRSNFDQAADLAHNHLKLSVANAQGGDYYVLLHGLEGAGSKSIYMLSAAAAAFEITDISPDRGSNEGDVTVKLTGSRFTEQTTVALTSIVGVVSAVADVVFVDSRHLQATFHLERDGVPEDFFNVRATDHGQTVTAAELFEVGGTGGNVSLTITAPGFVRVGQQIPVTINVRNSGGSNGIAPIIEVRASNVAENQKKQQFFANGDGENLPGIIPPGADSDIGIMYQPVPNVSGSESGFNLIVANPSTTLMDWESKKEEYRPSYVSPEAWDVVWANFRPRMGHTLADFYSVLMDDSRALSSAGDFTTEVHELLHFEIEKAANTMPALPLAGGTDLAITRQGPPLMYGRTLGVSLFDRFREGRLGIGWTDNYDLSVTTDANGLVTVQAGSIVRFFGKLDDGSYVSFPGETGKLTAIAGGGLELRERNGTATGFLANGDFAYFEDNENNRVTAEYIGGRLTRVVHSDGGALNFTYNTDGYVSSVTGPDGAIVTYAYDAAGHLTSVTTVAGITTYTYTAQTSGPREHALASITNPAGDHLFFEYDSQGRLARQTGDDPDSSLDYIYGVNGYSVTDGLGRTSSKFFDHSGQTRLERDTLGRYTRFNYDELGRLVSITPPGGGAGTFEYDAAGNPTAQIDILGGKQTFTYEPTLNGMTSWTDALGNRTQYAMDASGRPLSTTYADGTMDRFSYDAEGNLSQTVSRAGESITYTYNADDRLSRKEYQDGSRIDYSYDARGNLKAVTDATGTITMEYDAADRMTKVTYPSGRFLEYDYDAAGRASRIADQSGFAVNYAYDEAGRLGSVTDGSGGLVVRYAYDGSGQLLRQDRGNGTATTYEYDASGQLVHLVHLAPDSSVQAQFDYTYDSLGRPESVTTAEGKTEYVYDGGGRLISVKLPNGRVIAYQYDAAGNRVAVDDGGAITAYAVNSLGAYTTVGGGAYGYDLNGNLTTGGGTSRSYDIEGRLVGTTGPDGTWTYQYDALGKRVSATHNGQTTHYLNDASGLGNVFAEYDGSGNLIAHYTQGGGLASRTSASGEAAYYGYDSIGNTTLLTGSGGAVLNSYNYLPFGEILGMQESIANPFTFGGMSGVSREGAGSYYMRTRSYDPQLGRFVQPDLIGFAGGTNAYAYASNDPVRFIDPSGTTIIFAPMWGATMLMLPAGPVAAVSPLATTISPLAGTLGGVGGAVVSPLATTMTSGLATTMPGAFLTGAMPSSAFAATVPGAALSSTVPGALLPSVMSSEAVLASSSLMGTNISFAGITGAQVDALIAASQAAQAAPAAAGALEGVPIGIGIASWLLGAWYLSSLMSAGMWGLWHNGHLPPCGFDSSSTLGRSLNFISVCEVAPIDGLPSGSASTKLVGPVDPNELFGPGGFGSENFIQPEGLFPYVIYFENKSSALAPAQIVSVTEQLDADLDWSTFEFGDLGWGDFVLDVPDGRQFYSTRVDRSAEQGLFVDVTAEFNAATGEATWTFVSLDPLTLDAPADPFAGFLPPNNAEHDGEGFTTYFIRPKEDLATGTAVEAVATIVFDTEASLDTPLWINVIDSGGPSSSVDALAVTTASADFTVSWSGADDAGGSGIASFDVFVSDNGGAYAAFLTATTDTSALFHGVDGHTYAFYSVATDNVGHREVAPATADATTTLQAANNAPIADDDAYTTRPGQPLTVAAPGVLGNDSDADGDTVTVDLITDSVDHGTLSLFPDGHFSYTPEAGFIGTDTFVYLVGDGHGNTDSATVTIQVFNTNPVAGDDSYNTRPGQPLTVGAPGVLGNDTDADGDTVTAGLITDSVDHGTLSLFPDGHFSYTPEAGFIGTDTFVYLVGDGFGGADSATVTIQVFNTNPVADDDSYTVEANTTLDVAAPGVLGNDTDADGDTVTASLITDSVDHGTLSLFPDGHFSYTPEAGFIGTDTFAYLVGDGFGGTDLATVSITVTADNAAPVAVGDAFNGNEDQPINGNVLTNDMDVDDSTLTAGLVAAPSHGSVVLNSNGSFTYTPNKDYFGPDTFTYRANDGEADSNVATVTITLAPVDETGENHAPVVTANEGLSGVLPGQSVNAGALFTVSDADGDTPTQYEFWDDGSGGGVFKVNGVAQGANRSILVSAAGLANTIYQGGAQLGSEFVWMRAHDGTTWSQWVRRDFATQRPGNEAPVVDAVATRTSELGQWHRLSDFISVTDAEGDAVQAFRLKDTNAADGSARLWYHDYLAPGERLTVRPTRLTEIWIQGGTNPGTDVIEIEAKDNQGAWSKLETFDFVTRQFNHAPVVAPNDEVTGVVIGQSVNAGVLFKVSDEDGDSPAQYEFWDEPGAGVFKVNGIAQASGQSVRVSPANLANIVYEGGAQAGSEKLYLRVHDGMTWSEWTRRDMATQQGASALTLLSPSPTALLAVTKGSASEVNGYTAAPAGEDVRVASGKLASVMRQLWAADDIIGFADSRDGASHKLDRQSVSQRPVIDLGGRLKPFSVAVESTSSQSKSDYGWKEQLAASPVPGADPNSKLRIPVTPSVSKPAAVS
jgi:RHS repeat-associated protein